MSEPSSIKKCDSTLAIQKSTLCRPGKSGHRVEGPLIFYTDVDMLTSIKWIAKSSVMYVMYMMGHRELGTKRRGIDASKSFAHRIPTAD
jgi:hypothetical protein